MPDSPQAWLEEIAVAYKDAREAIPFGPLAGEVRPKDLFHLGPCVCVKFRGVKRTKALLRKATDAALSSYVATEEELPDMFVVPQLAFAFMYLASHFGLDMLDEQQVDAVMQYVEQNAARLIALTKPT